MKNTINLALLQQKYDENIIEKTIANIKLASKNAELILLSELHTTQYFCQSYDVEFFKYADDFEGHVKLFGNLAKELNITLVTSLFEKRARGLYHNSVVVFDKSEKIAGMYRKMHIPDDEQFYEKFYFTPGDLGFTPIKTSIGNLGILICWDQWYPEAARIMALNGADLLIYPTAIGWIYSDTAEDRKKQLDAWITIQRSHSIANGLPVASINRVGFEKISKDSNRGIEFFGNSFVSGTQGEFLAHAGMEEEIIYATINLNDIDKVRNIWPFLRDRRIDSYNEILMRYKNG